MVTKRTLVAVALAVWSMAGSVSFAAEQKFTEEDFVRMEKSENKFPLSSVSDDHFKMYRDIYSGISIEWFTKSAVQKGADWKFHPDYKDNIIVLQRSDYPRSFRAVAGTEVRLPRRKRDGSHFKLLEEMLPSVKGAVWHVDFELYGVPPEDVVKKFMQENPQLKRKTIVKSQSQEDSPVSAVSATVEHVQDRLESGNQLIVMTYTRWNGEVDTKYTRKKLTPEDLKSIEKRMLEKYSKIEVAIQDLVLRKYFRKRLKELEREEQQKEEQLRRERVRSQLDF